MKTRSTLRTLTLSTLTLGVLAFNSPAAMADWVLKFAHPHPTEDSEHLAAEHFAKQVEERTHGEVKVRIFPNGQLGSDQAMISGVQAGTIDIELSGNPYFSGMVGELGVLDLPFLFDNAGQAHKVLDSTTGRQLLDMFDAKGIKGLAFWEVGFRNLTNSRHAVHTAADIKGLKLRTTPNPAHLKAFTALGANPVPMPFAELFTSLETGTVDGQENPVTLIRSAKLYEVQKYLSLTAHAYTAAPVIMNKAKFDSLPKDYQDIVMDEALKAAAFQRDLNAKNESKDLAFLQEQGMEVVSDPDRDSMRKVVEKPVRDWFVEKYGSQWLDAIEQAKQAAGQ